MNNATYYVCHGPDAVHYVESDGSSTMVSGQPNIEQFDNEQEAIARAEDLGYVFTTDIEQFDNEQEAIARAEELGYVFTTDNA